MLAQDCLDLSVLGFPDLARLSSGHFCPELLTRHESLGGNWRKASRIYPTLLGLASSFWYALGRKAQNPFGMDPCDEIREHPYNDRIRIAYICRLCTL